MKAASNARSGSAALGEHISQRHGGLRHGGCHVSEPAQLTNMSQVTNKGHSKMDLNSARVESCDWQISAMSSGPDHPFPFRHAPLNRMIADRLVRLEQEATERGERGWTVAALEKRHGLTVGALGKLRSGERRGATHATMKKIAAALGLDVDVLLTAMESSAAQVTSPAAPSTTPSEQAPLTIESDDETDALLDRAIVPGRHPFSAGVAVKTLLRERAALIRPEDDALAMVRAWLNAAARIIERGERATPGAIFSEVTRRSVALSGDVNERVDAELAGMGITPPSAPVPVAQQALKRRDRRGSRE